MKVFHVASLKGAEEEWAFLLTMSVLLRSYLVGFCTHQLGLNFYGSISRLESIRDADPSSSI